MVMGNFYDLPIVIISAILQRLGLFDIESLSRALGSSELSNMAGQLLSPHKLWMRNAIAMDRLFIDGDRKTYNGSQFPGHLGSYRDEWNLMLSELSHKQCEAFGLRPNGGPYLATSPSDLRSWMKLDGSFGWLRTPNARVIDKIMQHTKNYRQRAIAEPKKISALVRQAAFAGLTLPCGFETFLRSLQLHHCISSYRGWYFELSGLVKCPSEFGDDGRGYLCRFHWDQQSCAFAYLYLHPAGHHCVVVSSVDVYRSSKYKRVEDEDISKNRAEPVRCTENADDDGDDAGTGFKVDATDYGEEDLDDDDDWLVPHKLEFDLQSPTFEEYLVTCHFGDLLQLSDYHKEDNGLRDYVQHVYSAQNTLD